MLLSSCARRPASGTYGGKPEDFSYVLNVEGMSGRDRAAYGKSNYPFWSPLTEAEQAALRGLDRARGGDAWALLDLAVLAAGKPREAAAYAEIRRELRVFCDSLKEKVEGASGEKERARILYRAMWSRFFRGNSARPMEGYDFWQSTLPAILATGKFNCISSVLLYAVICRHFGLEIDVVRLPEHVFAQIRLRKGGVVEVETTHPDGFGVVHDEKFYREQSAWLRGLGQTVPTFADYRNRWFQKPWEAAIENMANQHVLPKTMAVEDRFRLAEIRAYLSPDSLAAALICTGFYLAEAGYLFHGKQWLPLHAMASAVAPLLEGFRRRFPADTGLGYRIAYVRVVHAYALASSGRLDGPFLLVADTALQSAPPRHPETPELASMLYAAWAMRWSAQVDSGRFALAAGEMNRIQAHCPDTSMCRNNRLWVHTQWIAHLWAKGDWEGVLEKSRIAVGIDSGKAPVIRENMKTAYRNWSGAYWNAENRRRAAEVLRKCLEEFPGEPECAKLLKAISKGS